MLNKKEAGTRVTIFGGGLVATEMALDLADRHDVTVIDKNKERLGHLRTNYGMNTVEADLSETENVTRLLAETHPDALAMALPGGIAFKVLETIVDSQAVTRVVDTSFFQENPFGELDQKARKNGQIIVVQMGIAPGVMNMPAAFHSGEIQIETARLYCGGLPQRVDNPLAHTPQFNPADNFKLFRYPTVLQNGIVVHEPAFSGQERVHIPGLPDDIPYLEAVNTAGIMASVDVLDGQIQNMTEKSLRHPGHIRAMEALYKLGLFDEGPIGLAGQFTPYEITSRALSGHDLSALDRAYTFSLLGSLGLFANDRWLTLDRKTTWEEFTLNLIQPIWQPSPGEDTMTAAKIELYGRTKTDGKGKRIVYSLVHTAAGKTGRNSLAPTTAFPATATLQAILEGRFAREGINGPEHFAMAGDCFEYLLNYLWVRGIEWKREELDFDSEPR